MKLNGSNIELEYRSDVDSMIGILRDWLEKQTEDTSKTDEVKRLIGDLETLYLRW